MLFPKTFEDMKRGHMKKIMICLFPFVFLLEHTIAQEQAGQLQSDISNIVSSFDLPPIRLDASIGYQSNIDLLDPTQYKINYRDNGIINLAGSTTFQSEILDKSLTYSTSLRANILEAPEYEKSSDILRRVNFNNSLFLNLFSQDDKISFGPTLDLNAEKRYQYVGSNITTAWHRKRDNVNGFIGLKANVKASSDLMISSAVAAGYLDHNGNYTNPDSGFRAFEKNLEEDRNIFKASVTSVLKAHKKLTLSLPLTYQRDNFTQRRARAAKRDYLSMDRDLASWTTENNQPYMDETLDIRNMSAGLAAEIAMGSITGNVAYTFLDDQEMNPGHGRSNADTDYYEMSLSTDIANANIALSYNNENIQLGNLAGGSTEITQSYITDIKLANLIKDVSANVKLSYTDYQFANPNGNWAEKAEDLVAMVGITSTL